MAERTGGRPVHDLPAARLADAERASQLNDPASRITGLYGPLRTIGCDGYSVLTLTRRNAVTAFYVLGDRLWAFGLSRPDVALCR